MSHKATNWLAGLPAKAMSSTEFRVMFHLCDCHNPSRGCFPTQQFLRENAGVSNGTLNNALNGLERKGLIKRHQSRHDHTKRQRPTVYILGFEIDAPQEPSPDTGDGNRAGKRPEPTPETGDGAVSNLGPEPSPISGQSRLQPAGEKPVKEPVKNRAMAGDPVEFWANVIAEGRPVAASVITVGMAGQMLERQLVTEAQLKARGIAF